MLPNQQIKMAVNCVKTNFYSSPSGLSRVFDFFCSGNSFKDKIVLMSNRVDRNFWGV
jgi:hypothetical protein